MVAGCVGMCSTQACVEHNANGSIDCCCHTIPASVPPMYTSLPITSGACNLSKWQNPHYTFTKHSLPAVTHWQDFESFVYRATTRLSTAVLCYITLFCPLQDCFCHVHNCCYQYFSYPQGHYGESNRQHLR